MSASDAALVRAPHPAQREINYGAILVAEVVEALHDLAPQWVTLDAAAPDIAALVWEQLDANRTERRQLLFEADRGCVDQFDCPKCKARAGTECWNLAERRRGIEVHTKWAHEPRRLLTLDEASRPSTETGTCDECGIGLADQNPSYVKLGRIKWRKQFCEEHFLAARRADR